MKRALKLAFSQSFSARGLRWEGQTSRVDDFQSLVALNQAIAECEADGLRHVDLLVAQNASDHYLFHPGLTAQTTVLQADRVIRTIRGRFGETVHRAIVIVAAAG